MTEKTERGVIYLGEKLCIFFSLLLGAFGFSVGLGYCDFDLDALWAMYDGFLTTKEGFLAFWEGVFFASFVSVICAAVGLLVNWLLPKLRRKK